MSPKGAVALRSDRRAVNPQLSALLRVGVGLGLGSGLLGLGSGSGLLRVRGVGLALLRLRVGLASGLFGVGLAGRWPRRVASRWGCWRGRGRV